MFKKMMLISAFCAFATAKMMVSVSIAPQAFFIQKIAGDLVGVNIMVPSSKSPEIYEPTIKQLQNLADSKAYFNIGMPFERAWEDRFKAANPNMAIIPHLKSGEMEQYLNEFKELHESSEHAHSELHAHAPHIWLSFILSKAHIRQIAETLVVLDFNNAAIYKKNLGIFLGEIDKSYAKYKKIFKKNKKSYLVYHPAWSYVARELGLNEISIEVDGKEAKIAHTKEIYQQIANQRIKTIFIQPQFSKKRAQAIAKENNLIIEVADPLAFDWLNELENFLNKIAKN